MANDPEVYVVDSNGSLATIDLTTGAVAIIGKPSVKLTSIAFSPTGQLYGTDGNALYSVDQSTGKATEIGAFGNSVSIPGIRFAGDGTLYGTGTGGQGDALYDVNPATGSTRIIASEPLGTSTIEPGFVNRSLDKPFFYNGLFYDSFGIAPRFGSTIDTVNPTNYHTAFAFSGPYLGTFVAAQGNLYDVVGTVVYSVNTTTGAETQLIDYGASGLGNAVAAASPTEAAPQGAFYIADGTTGGYSYAPASPYSGPAAGPTSEFVTNTSDVLNVTALVPSAFIEVGYVPGQQTAPSEGGINVSYANGNNVLDGYAGSNFLTGGSGSDTFYVDDRTLTQNSWSTVVNFHSGDGVTMWGVTAADFAAALDGKGAPGYTGLTLVFKAESQTAAVTLAGYTSADLLNGRLDVSYGATPDAGGVSGAPFMHIQGH